MRITRTVADAVTNHNTNVRRTQTYFWDTSNSSTAKLISTTETSTDGLQTWETTWNNAIGVTTNTVTTYDRANHRRTITVTAPNNTVARSIYQDGRLQSLTSYGTASNQLGQTTYAYDAHGRVQYVTDARNGTVTNIITRRTRLPVSPRRRRSAPRERKRRPSSMTRCGGRSRSIIRTKCRSITNIIPPVS